MSPERQIHSKLRTTVLEASHEDESGHRSHRGQALALKGESGVKVIVGAAGGCLGLQSSGPA